jgi:hypothetical protein
MLQQAKDKVARGESTKAQDVDKRIQTQLNKLSEIAVALKGIERTARQGGDGGKLTYVLMASTSTANGVPRTVCFESRNLLQWTVQTFWNKPSAANGSCNSRQERDRSVLELLEKCFHRMEQRCNFSMRES